MKKDQSQCVVYDLASHMAGDEKVKAVYLDAGRKQASFAFRPGSNAEDSEERLQSILSRHKPGEVTCSGESGLGQCEKCRRGLGRPLPPGIRLVSMPEDGVMLQKETCETANRFLKWRRHKWVRVQPRVFPTPETIRNLSEWKLQLLAAILCGAAMVLGLVLEWIGGAAWMPFAVAAYLVSYAAGAWYPAQEVRELLRKRILDIHFLMLCVAAGAALIGHWWEGGMLLFLFSLSGALEEMAMARTKREIDSLFKEAPREATVVDHEGTERKVAVDDLKTGMQIKIRPGEQVAVDAEVVDGTSAADEANLTGESVPVDKKPGDTVLSGTMNLWGALTCRILRPASESALSRIIHLIREAQESKAPSQRFTDRFGTGYTYLILGFSLAMFFVWWLVLDLPAFKPPEGGASAFYRAMTLLVVASPCALVLSIPSAILAGIAAGARRGVLFRGGAAIENLAGVQRVALDKTGTLTTGDLKVIDVQSVSGHGETDLLRLAASVATHSSHPVSRAIIGRWREEGQGSLAEVTQFRDTSGYGIEAELDGETIRLGRRTLFEREDWIRDMEQPEPGITEAVLEAGEHRGRILLADEVREVSADLLDRLRTRGLAVTMLTGDRQESAGLAAETLHLEDIRAGLYPEDKVRTIQAWEQSGERVAMVGDGVNDAPSLAAAHVSVGMGLRGSDAVLEQADVVLMHDRLENFYTAYMLSRRATAIIRQNLAISLGVIAVLVISALGGAIPLTLGVIGHEGSTVVVVLNSLRLLVGRHAP